MRLHASEGDIGWPRIPVEIDDLDQLGDILDGWGVAKKPSQLDVQRALDRHGGWVGGIVAVRKLKGPGEIGRAGSSGEPASSALPNDRNSGARVEKSRKCQGIAEPVRKFRKLTGWGATFCSPAR